MNPGNKGRAHCHLFFLAVLLNVVLALLPQLSWGQVNDSLLSVRVLKKLSLEELMDIEVMSVSKRPEKLTEVASAIQVITQKDIRASGARTLAEALRLAPNLQVAQVNSSEWAISARGFNNVLANKLLVLIDGRTIYTPLYAGVFWDVQNLLLEDVDRIEVISGPGGTLWGANAVNGVINIITKSAADTKGFFAEAAAGSNLPGLGSLRYGGKIGKNLFYRVFGTGFKMGSVLDTNGVKANDEWTMFKAGSRFDWEASEKDKLSLQVNWHTGRPDPDANDTAVIANGDNIVARWNRALKANAALQLQVYYDHTFRDFGSEFTEDLKTFDIDWQNRYPLGKRHILTYGLGFRFMDHSFTNHELAAFLPAHKKLYLYNIFVQDEMTISNFLRLTIGSKIEHNSYTGFEYQPNARFTWTPESNQTIWAAVSRAVRTPARIDREFFIYSAPNIPRIVTNDNFVSETLMAYELGWRSQPFENLSFSLATFYNVYDKIRSIEPGPPPSNFPVTLGNGVKGKSYGIEASATYQLTDWWSLRGGYTFLKKDLSVKAGSKDLNKASAESNDPRHQFLIQSTMDLPGGIETGVVIRYIDKLPKPHVPGYTGLDLRIGWKLSKAIELSVVGQNLLDKRHIEFIASTTRRRQIERNVYGKVLCRF
ncbi:TonB-dependent receptor plug domain-containing protein [Terrimonas pollutisoli]|uniref:TonB-dependent receptor plug domain-containing protein n=1 Tax=Terrimonas pollutisoli TaxID=3034147 RepID=UPI0023ED2B20|nr:TonB-dependent receptor [Terrimonas sp. H1YJ31]